MNPTPDRSAARPGLSAATTVVGVIGDPVAHSLSPRLHNAAFAALGLDWVSVGSRSPARPGRRRPDRRPGPRGPGAVGDHAPQGGGGRRWSTGCTPLAERLGAVNCVIFGDEGTVGDNTDGPGLVAALAPGSRVRPAGQRCLVVGAGGAARAVVAALADAGAAEVVVVNRTRGAGGRRRGPGRSGRPGGHPADATRSDLVVNATPVGMADSEPAGTDVVAGRSRLLVEPASWWWTSCTTRR